MDCTRCCAVLLNAPEYEQGEWFIRCLECGVKNLLASGIEIIGWKKEA